MVAFVVLNTGIPNLDKFSELYVYSSGYIEDEARAEMKENFAELLNDPQANKRFNVPLYFAAGETDIALNNISRRWQSLTQQVYARFRCSATEA